MASAAPADDASSQPTRWNRWFRIAALALAAILVAFGIAVLINSQAVVGSVHARNARSLEVIAGDVESWPRVASDVAKNNYVASAAASPEADPESTQAARTFGLRYSADCSGVGDPVQSDRFFPPGRRPGDADQLYLSGSFTMPGATTKICFVSSTSLDRLVDVARSAPEFTALLIVGPDGHVIDQIGKNRLPAVRLPDFAPPNAFARDLSSALLPGQTPVVVTDKSDASRPTLDSSIGATSIRIADVDYFAYVRPVRIDLSGRPCPDASRPKSAGGGDAAETAQDPSPESAPWAGKSAGPSCQLFLVGLMPTTALRRAWLAPPPVVLTSYGLGLLLALSLLPVGRLLLIGGSEAISAAEVIAIVFGVYAAAAIAALAVLFAVEVAGERSYMRAEARQLVAGLARSSAGEIDAALKTIEACQVLPVGSQDKPPPWSWRHNVYESRFISELGTPSDPAKAPPIMSCSAKSLPQSIDVGARPFFRKLVQQRSDLRLNGQLPYTMGQVRAQNDGISKTSIQVDFGSGNARPGAAGARYLVASTLSRTFLAPVLPPPQQYIVVDASDDLLPVLFHSKPGRALHEDFASAIGASRSISQALAALSAAANGAKAAEPGLVNFERRYDGVNTSFSAAAIPHTDWVVLVFHSVDDVDAIAAATALRAMLSWASVALVGFLLCGWFLFRKRAAWLCLWPFRNGEGGYEAAVPIAWRAGAAIVGVTALLLLIPRSPIAIAPAVAVVILVLTCRSVYRRLCGLEVKPQPLRRRTERSYRGFVLAMLLGLAVAPMFAFWADARLLSRDLVDGGRIRAAAAGVRDRAAEVSRLQRAVQVSPAVDALHPWGFGVGQVSAAIAPGGSREMSREAAKLQSGVPIAEVRHCPGLGGPETLSRWYCWRVADGSSLLERIAVRDRGLILPSTPLAWGLIVLLALGLAASIYAVVFFGLWALTGFGIPLNAVVWPKLVIGSATPVPADNERGLARKTLLVAAQRPLRDRIVNQPEALAIDLGETALPQARADVAYGEVLSGWLETLRTASARYGDGKVLPRTLVVSGLELVLRDPPRRQAALGLLEHVAAGLTRRDAKFDRLIVLTDMSPLERILDAFDSFEKDSTRTAMREELRWAALFQNFATFCFPPVDKIKQTALDEALPRRGKLVPLLDDRGRRLEAAVDPLRLAIGCFLGKIAPGEPLSSDDSTLADRLRRLDRQEREALIDQIANQRTLVEELRWLPANVIDSVLAQDAPRIEMVDGQPRFVDEAGEAGEPPSVRFPIEPATYQAYYTHRVIEWAIAVDPVTQEAAIDFLRANVIEHFEQCWASSTCGERVILDAQAHGSYVNLRKAVAMQSLVRRGLVVFDPAPRLMSRSFACFIRQTERPDSLADWRRKQKSAWSLARLPVAVLFPLLLIGLAVAAAEAGQDLSALVPLLAAGAPALIGTVLRSARGGAG